MQRVAWLFLIVLAVFPIGCSKKSRLPDPIGASEQEATRADELTVDLTDNQKRIRTMMRSENLIESLADSISLLAVSFRDRSVSLDEVMLPSIEYRGISEFDLSGVLQDSSHKPGLAIHQQWPLIRPDGNRQIKAAEIWAPLLRSQTFDDCQIGILGGNFEGPTFHMDTKFEGRFRTLDSQLVGVKANQTVEWVEQSDRSWRIAGWEQTSFEVVAAPRALFEDVTAEAIPDPTAFHQVQKSSHTDLIVKNAQMPGWRMEAAHPMHKPFSDWESSYQYPCVSVVDLDQDGWDDLFISDRWQPAQLLRNCGDGTFEDVTAASGLNVNEMTSCALFADFDNDGDSDVFVAGTLAPSQYYENVEGVFQQDHSLDDQNKDVRFVVSGSVVDVNGDGLLDLYLNTYGVGTGEPASWTKSMVRVADRVKLHLKVERSHIYVDRAGPPNILLINRGGKLERVAIGDTLAQWRNSYQTVWTDFDQDGDQDLYVCNDFSPDHFLRNDTPRGSFAPRFTEISETMTPGGTMGFGMGASWGDYNNDGRLDLYISNMYSKAGNRIVAQLEDVDERIQVSSRGNFLYQSNGDTFEQVAGFDADSQHVSKVGWSFGGQFADFDNDGNLDIYVPSGFYSPPDQVRKEGDL